MFVSVECPTEDRRLKRLKADGLQTLYFAFFFFNSRVKLDVFPFVYIQRPGDAMFLSQLQQQQGDGSNRRK